MADLLAHLLTSHPDFGDTARIQERVRAFYGVAVAQMNREGFIFGPDCQVETDPILRLLVHDWLTSGDPEVGNLAMSLSCRPGLSTLNRRPEGAAVWAKKDVADSEYIKYFEQAFEDYYLPNLLTGTPSTGHLIEPSHDHQVLLASTFDFLLDSVPELAKSVLPHVKLICWATVGTNDASMISGSTRRIPGVIFLSPDDLSTRSSLAEALIHEAAHLKLFDLYLTLDLLGPTYDALTSDHRISVPWNPPHSLQMPEWPPDQALAAMHTYLHIGSLALGCLNSPGEDYPTLLARSAERSSFLARALFNATNDFLGATGIIFLEWCHGIALTLEDLSIDASHDPFRDVVRSAYIDVGNMASFFYWEESSHSVRRAFLQKGGDET